MKHLGSARRGDVVFLRVDPALNPTSLGDAISQSRAVADETGVRIVFLQAGIVTPVGLAPRQRPRRARGATPRWCR